MRSAIAWTLLGAGAALQLFAVLGVVLMRDTLDRLHYLAPASLAGVLIAAAVVVRESFSLIGIWALLLAGFLLFTGPVLAHVTGRAILLAREEAGRE
jgi:multisubunit Na+/H+ antiporter MnhG subunit